MADVVLKNVYKEYEKGVRAVSDFSLEIADKEFVVLVGPSGCGKSTTLRMIAGLEDITGGSVYIDGRMVNDVEPKNRDIAMVFQNYALYPHMSVYENIALSLVIRKYPKSEIKRRVEEVAKTLDIFPYLKKKPRVLSGGQRQRVALGRAIVREPKVFLLDEPLSNLDAKLRTQMRTEIIKLHQRLGTTFIYVTHDQTEAMTMATKIVVMKDGFIQQADTPHGLYAAPKNVFVAGFIGTPQMNFIPAVVKEESGAYSVAFAGLEFGLAGVDGNALREYAGKEVILGVRPEHIHMDPHHVNRLKAYTFTAKIEVAELMGAETYLDFTLGENNIVARVPSDANLQAGREITLAIDMNKVHLFDRDTEKRIETDR
jgi:multiple sugar transport system ATP-binding protein